MSETVQIALIGLGVAVVVNVGIVVPVLVAVWMKMQATKEASEQRSLEVKNALALAAEKNQTSLAFSEKAIEQISGKQDEQHKLMNSRLDEMKRIITEAAIAKGVLQGKAELQAEMNAKEVAKLTQPAVAPSAPTPVVVIPPATPAPPLPVKVIPAEDPLPVEVTVKKSPAKLPEAPH